MIKKPENASSDPNMTNTLPILDNFGRIHNNLRVSVTDRCNIRCFYCMPENNVTFLPRPQLLTLEEITRLVSIMAKMGVDRIRLTGGEPLVRRDLWKLVEWIHAIPQIKDIALTTNGLVLAEHAAALRKAGLNRLNISLDTLSEATFERISRRKGLSRVLEGIRVAQEVGFDKIRLNAVSMAGITEDDIVPLAEFARREKLELRFIEFMPLDAEGNWQTDSVISGETIRKTISKHVAPMTPAERTDPSQPATDFDYEDGQGRVGFINPVSQPFCSSCNRLRLTAEGKVRNCLFSTTEWDTRELIRSGATDTEIEQVIRDCVSAKKAAHGIDSEEFQRPEKAMYQIGG